MAQDQDHLGLESSVISPLKIAVLGMPCDFTRSVLSALLGGDEEGIRFQIDTVILGIPGSETRSGIERPAGFSMVPGGTAFRRIGSRSALSDGSWLHQLEARSLDLIVTACFPWRLPRTMLAMPRFGCLNVHPSLLPQGRGPEPVFWAFRWGLDETGVTVHHMDGGLDTGPIHAQVKVPIGDDATMQSLEAELAVIGGTLARQTVENIVRGSATPAPQPRSVFPIARIPGPDDVSVFTDQPAVAAARFIRAVSPVLGRVGCLVVATGYRFMVQQRAERRTGFSAAEMIEVREDDPQIKPVLRIGDIISVRFTPGVIRFRRAPETTPLTLHPRTRPGRR